jgi:dTDP-glucose pyrophosphorylase/CBS domain-containing protein
MFRLNTADLFVKASASIRDTIKCIDNSGRISLALLVDQENRLVSVFTDGDVRRAILRGIGLDAPVTELLPIKSTMPNSRAVTAPVNTPRVALLQIMQEKGIRQLPLVDESGSVVDIVLLQDLLPRAATELQAVIMAGGFGKRLRPLTDDIPKPMLPVGGRPIMERIVEQLQEAGIRRVNVATHYKSEKIVQHFGSGEAFGVEMRYVNEDRPLGTGGALSLMEVPDKPLLVVNGDVLTTVDYRQMFEFHQENKADMTVAVNLHVISVPFGVVDCENARVCRVREKPDLKLLVNAGIYLLEPDVFAFVHRQQHFHMTELIQWLIEAGRSVVSFPIREVWLDVGRPQDYEKAQTQVEAFSEIHA